jgi:large subunit ribosomal protein L3
MKIILGTKEKMTQLFGEDGKVYPATVLNAGPVVVTQVKTENVDGYEAVQVGFGEKKAHNINKAKAGHLKDLGNFRYLKEFRLSLGDDAKVGTKIDASVFESGDRVRVVSISKGKGFQGVIKRHGFSGGSRTHGQKHSERSPGSIGGRGRAGGRVSKGMKMGGRMGGDRVTLQGVQILQVNKDANQIIVKGGVPGRRGTLVEIQG